MAEVVDLQLSLLRSSHLIELLAVLTLFFYVLRPTYQTFFGKLSKFPGPRIYAWCHLSNIIATILGRNHDTLEQLHRQYGSMVRIGPKELSFTGPEAWKDIYGHAKAGRPKASRDPRHYGDSNESIISADDHNGILTSLKCFSIHNRIRRTLQPAFSERSLKDAEPLLKQWAAKMLMKLIEHATTDRITDILKMYNCTTFDIMGDLTFGENLGMLDNSEYSPWVQAIFSGIKMGCIIGGFKRTHWLIEFVIDKALANSKTIQKLAKEHDEYSSKRVDRRMESTPERPDLWTRILDKSEASQSLTIKEHYSTASIFMIAGTETSATALSGMTYYLLRNPEAMAKLVQEIRSTFTCLDDVRLDSLQRLKYLSAVIQEGLRLYPPVPGALPRITPQGGMMVCGEWVPEGVTVGVHQVATCYSESYFTRPSEFRPERWLGDPAYANDQLNANEPFSTGTRNCIGKTLAYHEMRLLLTTVILNFDLELCPESSDWRTQRVYGLWEKKPLFCKLRSVM